MKTRIEKVGSIYIEVPESENPVKRNGAGYLRRLVKWLDSRPDELNDNKSHLDLIVEYNTRNR
jgi:hypothetical protein